MKGPSRNEAPSASRQSGGRSDPAISLRMYVAGLTPNSQRARANLQTVLASVRVPVDVEIIDVLSDTRRAMADNVFVTPTLLGLGASKPQVMIGDLSDTDLVRTFVLGLVGADT